MVCDLDACLVIVIVSLVIAWHVDTRSEQRNAVKEFEVADKLQLTISRTTSKRIKRNANIETQVLTFSSVQAFLVSTMRSEETALAEHAS